MKSDIFNYDYKAAGLLDQGKKRDSNEDEIIMADDAYFFGVTDGMSGLLSGDVVSKILKKTLHSRIKDILMELTSKDYTIENAEKLLKELIQSLSDDIFKQYNHVNAFRTGATLTGAWLLGDYAIFINIGDSRSYLLHNGDPLKQISTDHNLAALLVQCGEITKEEARTHPAGAQLRRFIGMKPPATPETFLYKVQPGDCLLFCSDGLHGMIYDDEIEKVMRQEKDGETIVKELVDMANENGGEDNISVVYVKIAHKMASSKHSTQGKTVRADNKTSERKTLR